MAQCENMYFTLRALYYSQCELYRPIDAIRNDAIDRPTVAVAQRVIQPRHNAVFNRKLTDMNDRSTRRGEASSRPDDDDVVMSRSRFSINKQTSSSNDRDRR